jgi:hypothetical protein
VPTTPDGIWRLPVIGSDRRVFGEDVLLRPFTPRGAPIVEWVPGDPFDRDGFGRDGRHRDRDGRDRFRDGRDRDRDGRDRFRDGRDGFGRDGFDRNRRRSGFDGFDRGCGETGLRLRVGSKGVSIGVGSRDSRRDGFRTRCDSGRGGVIILPAGTTYYGGTYYGADSQDETDGYQAENANGAAFSGSDRPGYGATGCAAVTVRLRGGEWYGGLVRLPALDAETPEALAAALRTRHRHGRSTMLEGFEGNNLAVPAGPGVEGVDVEPCF